MAAPPRDMVVPRLEPWTCAEVMELGPRLSPQAPVARIRPCPRNAFGGRGRASGQGERERDAGRSECAQERRRSGRRDCFRLVSPSATPSPWRPPARATSCPLARTLVLLEAASRSTFPCAAPIGSAQLCSPASFETTGKQVIFGAAICLQIQSIGLKHCQCSACFFASLIRIKAGACLRFDKPIC